MSTQQFTPKTVGGYNMYHAVSAFQKYVRRGMVHEAIYFGTELLISNFHNYAWYRIKVMASEDIGLANNDACVQVRALHDTFNEFVKDKRIGAAQMVFCHAVLLITTSPKSRIVDNLYCKHVDLRKHVYPVTIHDFCYDQFTDVGKRKGRGNEFFYDVSGVILNVPETLQEEEEKIKQEVQEMYRMHDAKMNFQVNIPEEQTLFP